MAILRLENKNTNLWREIEKLSQVTYPELTRITEKLIGVSEKPDLTSGFPVPTSASANLHLHLFIVPPQVILGGVGSILLGLWIYNRFIKRK